MSPFDYYLLSIFTPSLVHCWLPFYLHIWSLAWFMSQASWNCWNLLSFIGVETSHRLGPEKHSAIDVVKNIIDGVITGLNFLYLWGEERALRLRTGTTGQWFYQNTCLVKPQEESTNVGIQRTSGLSKQGGWGFFFTMGLPPGHRCRENHH